MHRLSSFLHFTRIYPAPESDSLVVEASRTIQVRSREMLRLSWCMIAAVRSEGGIHLWPHRVAYLQLISSQRCMSNQSRASRHPFHRKGLL